MLGNLASSEDPQQAFKNTFKALINEDYSISTDIGRYQGVVERILPKLGFNK